MNVIIGLVAFFMVATSVAAELRLWHQKEEGREWLPKLAEQYEAATGVKVHVSFRPTGELRASLLRGVIEGNTPHVAIVPSDFIGDYHRLQLTPLGDQWFGSRITPSAMPLVTLAGNHYGIPILGGNHLMLFYNKRYVKQPATSWQELAVQAKELRSQGIEPIAWKYEEMYWFTAFATAFGAFPVSDNQINLDTPEMRAGLEFYKRIADKGLVDPKCDYKCAFDDFNSGQYAYVINGDWAYGEMAEALGDNFGVSVLPSIAGNSMMPAYSGMALIFPADSTNGPDADALMDFVHFIQSKQVQLGFFQELSLLPVHQQVIEQIMATADDNQKASLAQLKQGWAVPPTPALTASWLGMSKGFQLYISGHGTVEQATNMMQRFAEHELKKSNK
ncbi:extracellular solute-binding protein [Neiella marina]|uniref:Extracellular solute-binding protein n=1 Tax=Neiella holothuriorum TaxID=2870530 RepID=A0ABS7EGJ0_9GAMM|nr:extracellular solute-binding protein [Neiella holothuriorum]MBW8191469.1 extracellular solute-binding protein [Neiella holothuriorum]